MKVKNLEVLIPLFGFKYSHDAFNNNDNPEEQVFIGRTKLIQELLDRLNKNKDSRGSYLVSGYRGVGKTSFVNEVIRRYKQNNDNVIDVRINLGGETELTTRNIMANVVSGLNDKLSKKNYRKLKSKDILKYLSIFGVFSFLAINIKSIILTFAKNADSTGPGLKSDSKLECIFFDLSFNSEYIQYCFFGFCNHLNYSSAWLIVSLLLFAWLYLLEINRKCIFNIHSTLEKLLKDIQYTTETQAGSKMTGLAYSFKKTLNPLTESTIENKLFSIFRACREKKLDIIIIFDELDKIDIGFDPEDPYKHSDIEDNIIRRMNKLNNLLGGMKNLITTSQSRMIFISGREIYDAYLSERGSTSSLYESLFNSYFYVPSLLSDHSDEQRALLDSMIETWLCSKLATEAMYKKHFENIESEHTSYDNNKLMKLANFYKITSAVNRDEKGNHKNKESLRKEDRYFLLKMFIHFMAFHTWGNLKAMNLLFENFVVPVSEIDSNRIEITLKGKDYEEPEKPQYVLKFDTLSIQRMVVSSQLYILFYNKLSKTLSHADDKLVVSSMAIYHYILRFHKTSFSKNHVARMHEVLNIHSAPDINRITDTILENILSGHIRRIRNSYFRYRFNSVFEQELHLITSMSDYESAAFNFSLNSIKDIKSYFNIRKSELEKSDLKIRHKVNSYAMQKSELSTILANYEAWEQNHDQAILEFGKAEIEILNSISSESLSILANDQIERETNIILPTTLNKGNIHDDKITTLFYNITTLVGIMLKKGNVLEKSGNYSAAASQYLTAKTISDKFFDSLLPWSISCNDSKYAIFRMPYWSLLYLNLKRSPLPYKSSLANNNLIEKAKWNNITSYRYQLCTYNFFIDNYSTSLQIGLDILKEHPENDNTERYYYLTSMTSLRIGLCHTLQLSHTLYEKIKSEPDNFENFHQHYTRLYNLSKISFKQRNTEKKTYHINDAFFYLNKAGDFFSKAQLHSLAGQSYISTISLFIQLIEAYPSLHENADYDLYYNSEELNIDKIRPLIKQAFTSAYNSVRFSSSSAFSHSNNTFIRRIIGDIEITNEHHNALGFSAILDLLITKTSHFKIRELDNFGLVVWHYSLFGQIIIALAFWFNLLVHIRDLKCAKNIQELKTIEENVGIIKVDVNSILPFSQRYYSTMLWLKGRSSIYTVYKRLSFIKNELTKIQSKDVFNPKHFPDDILTQSLEAVTYMYRASLYISQISADEQHIMLPPLCMVHYHQWQLIYLLINETGKQEEFWERANYLRIEFDKILNTEATSDVSSRVLDISFLEQQALASLTSIERLSDVSAKPRISFFRDKYYLDDDFEDIWFSIDWTFSRAMLPTITLIKEDLKSRMEKVRITDCKLLKLHPTIHL